MSDKETKTKTSSFRLSDAMKKRIKNEAATLGVSQSALIVIFVEAGLQQLEACQTRTQKVIALANMPTPF